MIFVTVGTHEQPFDRLIKEIDKLKKDNVITEEVFIQTGFTDYKPEYCQWEKLLPFDEMNKKIKEARIVITHGGPASFIAPLQMGKIPIVVPRKYEFNEHVNNHQVEFSEVVEKKHKNIILIHDVENIKDAIMNYDEHIKRLKHESSSNNEAFCNKFEEIVKEIFEEK